MKKIKHFISKAFICSFAYMVMYSSASAQTWVTTTDTVLSLTKMDTVMNVPVFSTFRFSTPAVPTLMDTLNLKFYYYVSGTQIGFQVLEHQYARFDSTQTDTLGYIVSSLIATNRSLLSSQNLPTINGFKGKEVSIAQNDPVLNRVLVTYMRLYYKNDSVITFFIKGDQNQLTELNADKNLFFNSIAFQ